MNVQVAAAISAGTPRSPQWIFRGRCWANWSLWANVTCLIVIILSSLLCSLRCGPFILKVSPVSIDNTFMHSINRQDIIHRRLVWKSNNVLSTRCGLPVIGSPGTSKFIICGVSCIPPLDSSNWRYWLWADHQCHLVAEVPSASDDYLTICHLTALSYLSILDGIYWGCPTHEGVMWVPHYISPLMPHN